MLLTGTWTHVAFSPVLQTPFPSLFPPPLHTLPHPHPTPTSPLPRGTLREAVVGQPAFLLHASKRGLLRPLRDTPCPWSPGREAGLHLPHAWPALPPSSFPACPHGHPATHCSCFRCGHGDTQPSWPFLRPMMCCGPGKYRATSWSQGARWLRDTLRPGTWGLPPCIVSGIPLG